MCVGTQLEFSLSSAGTSVSGLVLATVGIGIPFSVKPLQKHLLDIPGGVFPGSESSQVDTKM